MFRLCIDISEVVLVQESNIAANCEPSPAVLSLTHSFKLSILCHWKLHERKKTANAHFRFSLCVCVCLCRKAKWKNSPTTCYLSISPILLLCLSALGPPYCVVEWTGVECECENRTLECDRRTINMALINSPNFVGTQIRSLFLAIII